MNEHHVPTTLLIPFLDNFIREIIQNPQKIVDCIGEKDSVYELGCGPGYFTLDIAKKASKVYAADVGIKNLFTGFRDKGAIFENLVYAKIKKLEPRYVYMEGTEIDFITNNKILIEVKYGKGMDEKQQKIFDKIKANQKIVVHGISGYENLNI